MALSDVGLCARALVRLGAAPITSFNDETAESEIAAILYGSSRDALLAAYPWSFATGQMVLTPLVDTPVADYAFAYPGIVRRVEARDEDGAERADDPRNASFNAAAHSGKND